MAASVDMGSVVDFRFADLVLGLVVVSVTHPFYVVWQAKGVRIGNIPGFLGGQVWTWPSGGAGEATT